MSINGSQSRIPFVLPDTDGMTGEDCGAGAMADAIAHIFGGLTIVSALSVKGGDWMGVKPTQPQPQSVTMHSGQMSSRLF